MKIYKIILNNHVCGKIIDDNGRLSAELTDSSVEFPVALFGLKGELVKRNHNEVMAYITGRIAPPTRENIADLLSFYNLKTYDAWSLYKAVKGKNSKDKAYIEPEINNYNIIA